jgi:hypothetical protein
LTTILNNCTFMAWKFSSRLMNVRLLGLVQFPKWSGSGNKSGADGKCTN